MTKAIALVAVLSVGCGAILNGGSATLIAPQGVLIDGNPGTVNINKQVSHEVTYPNGARCIITSEVSVGYVVLDVVLWGLIFGVLVDGVTGDWKVLSAEQCPGIQVQ